MEAILYGDSNVSGEVTGGELGPYELLNPVAYRRPAPRPLLVVRATFHLPGDEEIQDATIPKTDQTTFHGGGVFDEIAALLSLALGIRCRSGGSTRHWSINGSLDGFGHPFEYDHHPPHLSRPTEPPILPEVASGAVDLSDLRLLTAYLSVDARTAMEMLRSSRMYERAVWVADDDPGLAWIWLVGAVEVAANHWSGASSPAHEVLEEVWPELAAMLGKHGQEHLHEVAVLLHQQTRATRKFLDFLMAHLPGPPQDRPEKWGQLDWSQMRAHLRTVYTYRSSALHAGTPFPLPMCMPPRTFDDRHPVEKPTGLGMYAQDARWRAEDTPMLLWTFEYVARGALLRYWTSLGTAASPDGAGGK